jgi:imidazolonepropionase-like amidohydrolase
MTRIGITKAQIVDVARGRLLPEASLVIENGQIKEIREGALGDLYPQLDAKGLYVAPGLIDGHVHFVFDCGADPRQGFLDSTEETLWETGRRNARAAIEAGITTARDCGAPVPWIFELQRQIDSGGIAGPHLLACGCPLTRPTGHLHFFGGEVSNRQEVRSLIERLAAQGASFAKLIASGGGLTPGTRPSEAELSLDLMREAVKTARVLGLRTAAHCHAIEAISRCLDVGMDFIEHASFTTLRGGHFFDEKIAYRMRDQGTIICPTVIGALRTAQRFKQSKRPHNAEDTATVPRLEARQSNLAGFHHLHLPLLGGTDCGITDTPFNSLVDELLLYQEAGMSCAQALRTVTSESARYLRLPRTGEIRVDYAADLILLDGNPLEDLNCLRQPVAVLKAGQVMIQRCTTVR